MGNVCFAVPASSLYDVVVEGVEPTAAAGRKSKAPPVVVLQANGSVTKISHKVRAGELMEQFPNHFLCLASSILIRRKSKMIPPKAYLQRGNIYLLLPFPSPPAAQASNEDRDTNPLLARSESGQHVHGTTKFVISKIYLDRILLSERTMKSSSAAKSKKNWPSCYSSKRSSSKDHQQQETFQRRSSITWSPALESIPESPLGKF